MSRDQKGRPSCTVAGPRGAHPAILAASKLPTVGARIGKALAWGLFLFALSAPPAAAQTFNSCQNDVQGANDVGGDQSIRDLTRYCAEPATGLYESFVQWDYDFIIFPPPPIPPPPVPATSHSCALYDTDGDGFANLAVCVTVEADGVTGVTPFLGAVRLFNCVADNSARSCGGFQQVSGNVCVGGVNNGNACTLAIPDCNTGGGACMPGPGKNTTCQLVQQPTDPFLTGEAFPLDLAVTCSVDRADFGSGASAPALIDTCSYTSNNLPNGIPTDCVGFTSCTANVQCQDSNTCTTDTCQIVSPGVGFCRHTPDTGESCGGDACTTGGTCASTGFCEGGGGTTSCDDGNPCTDDSCNPAGECINTPNPTNSCSDNNACNGAETCSATGVCQSGAAPVCNDNNPCTDDSCDPATGCAFTPNPANSCSDNNACNGAETCSAAGVCQSGTAPVCNDNNPCTDDSCNPATGCAFTPNPANSCSDNNACNGAETCSAAGVCQSGSAPVCNDNNPCTDDSCNPAAGCAFTPNPANSCSDNNACNGVETCSTTGTCQSGTAPVCNDNNACTDDSCNPSTGCAFTPDPTNNCSDNNACNGMETCTSTGTCQAGAALNCNDNNECTNDSCNPASGCANTPNTAPCSDGNGCTTGDACSGGSCVGGPPPDCDDDNVCTDDSCIPPTGCAHTNNSNACNDGDACTGQDICQGGVCGGSATSCKVTGGGQLVTGEKVSFGCNAQRAQTGYKGQVEYNNHTKKTAYHSLNIIDVTITPIPAGSCSAYPGNMSLSGRKAKVEGTIRRKGTQGELGFTLILEDCGEPGRNDYFNMTITDGEHRQGRLERGNIQVH